MHQIYYDTETTGSSTAFDSITEIYLSLNDENFQELENLHLRCRLKEGVIPNLHALLITKTTADQLKGNNLSHAQLIHQVYSKIQTWSPAYFLGYGSINFDVEFLRKKFFQNLQDPYIMNFNGNKNVDVLSLIRAAKLVKDDVIKTEISEKGNPIFKLDKLMGHQDAHGAKPDTIQAKKVSEIVFKKANAVWRSGFMTANRIDCENLIRKEKMFCNLEYFYGKLRIFLVHHYLFHPIYKWGICWDLQHHPKDYINLDKQALTDAMSKTPKIFRTVRTNKSPVLLNQSYSRKVEPYSKISTEDLNQRIEILEQAKDFKKLVSIILQEKALDKQHDKESNISQIKPEEKIYTGFPSTEEKQKMFNFHTAEWEDKVKFMDKFSLDYNTHFAKRYLYEEQPNVLPDSIYKEVKREIAQRILSTDEVNWTTVSEFYRQIDQERNKSENDPKRMKLLDEYNDFVMSIQKKYEAA